MYLYPIHHIHIICSIPIICWFYTHSKVLHLMKNVLQRIILQDYNVINITKVEVQLLFILGLSTGPPPFVIVVIYCRSGNFRENL